MKYCFFIFALFCSLSQASHQLQQPIHIKHPYDNLRIARWFHQTLEKIIVQAINTDSPFNIATIIKSNMNCLHLYITLRYEYYENLKKALIEHPNNIYIKEELESQDCFDCTVPLTPEEYSLYYSLPHILENPKHPQAPTLLKMLQKAFPERYTDTESLNICSL